MIEALLALYAQVTRQLPEVAALDDVELMTDAARRVLDAANDTDWPVEYRPAHCLLEGSAEKYPDRAAVVTPTEKLTYAGLNEKANRAAHSLIDLGVVPGQIVALMLPRCADVYVARQGILKAGGAFLSIAPDYPDERVQAMMEDSGAKVLIVTGEVLAERRAFIEGLSCRAVTVDDLMKDARADNPNIDVGPDELAYVIFTSGSTGKPKGVMLT